MSAMSIEEVSGNVFIECESYYGANARKILDFVKQVVFALLGYSY